jgi:hypothetical protein
LGCGIPKRSGVVVGGSCVLGVLGRHPSLAVNKPLCLFRPSCEPHNLNRGAENYPPYFANFQRLEHFADRIYYFLDASYF